MLIPSLCIISKGNFLPPVRAEVEFLEDLCVVWQGWMLNPSLVTAMEDIAASPAWLQPPGPQPWAPPAGH